MWVLNPTRERDQKAAREQREHRAQSRKVPVKNRRAHSNNVEHVMYLMSRHPPRRNAPM